MREDRYRFPPSTAEEFFPSSPPPPPPTHPTPPRPFLLVATAVIRAESADLGSSFQKHLIKAHRVLSIAKAAESHYGLAAAAAVGGVEQVTPRCSLSQKCAIQRNGRTPRSQKFGKTRAEAGRCAELGGDVGDRRLRITED